MPPTLGMLTQRVGRPKAKATAIIGSKKGRAQNQRTHAHTTTILRNKESVKAQKEEERKAKAKERIKEKRGAQVVTVKEAKGKARRGKMPSMGRPMARHQAPGPLGAGHHQEWTISHPAEHTLPETGQKETRATTGTNLCAGTSKKAVVPEVRIANFCTTTLARGRPKRLPKPEETPANLTCKIPHHVSKRPPRQKGTQRWPLQSSQHTHCWQQPHCFQVWQRACAQVVC